MFLPQEIAVAPPGQFVRELQSAAAGRRAF
jgi:hypothetical protein